MELACHYTTLEAFYGMLKSIDWDKKAEEQTLTFWGSSIYSMNDPQEFIYGYKLLLSSALPDIEKNLRIEDDRFKLSKIVNILGNGDIEEANRILIDYIYREHNVPFIISFTRNRDYLPMWNMYSNNSTGVCLCFSNNEYVVRNVNDIDIDIDIIHRLHAMDVSYGVISETINNTLHKQYKRFYEEYRNKKGEELKRKMLNYFTTLVLTLSPYHKHKAYKFEDEIRLVQFKENDSDIKYRISKKGNLIPYIEIPVKLKYLERVIVGPCADSPSIIRELQHILRKYKGNEKNFIIPSEIPYREI
ncbi:MAG: DUF2971 domain-containing protein [Bacteroidaceae bacterium]|nr:DUF2971 domain-containing protein [Bacteroidaceae bacterium]